MIRPRPNASRLTLVVLLGAASVLAYAPIGLFPLIWLTLGGLFAVLDRTADEFGRTHQGALGGAFVGAAFGFGLFMTGVSWIYVSLSTFGEMPAPLAALATVLFCGLIAAYPAIVGALYVRFAPGGAWRRSLFFGALWVLGEWLRGWVLTGFPWLAVGYSQAPPSPLAGFAPIIGVFGVSLTTVLAATLFREATQRTLDPARRRRALAPWLALFLLLGSGAGLRQIHWTSPVGEPIDVALLQGNVPQDLKWRPEKFFDSLRTYYRLALENPAQLTVLPETALPAFLGQVPPAYLDDLKKLAERRQGDMLLGIALGNATEYANGAVSLGTSISQQYRKSHLVPFGEFVPPGFAWFLSVAKIPMSAFTPGAGRQPPMRIAGQAIAVNICYEDAFGEEIIRALPEAGLLVNLSNVAWFGDSLAPAQHLQIAQMRALEAGRTMLRATNTGMTAIVGADGSVQAVLEPFTRGALRGRVRAYAGATPYVKFGNWPIVTIALLLVAAFARRRKAVS